MYEIAMRVAPQGTDGSETGELHCLFFAVVEGAVEGHALEGKDGEDKVLGILRAAKDRREADRLYGELRDLAIALPESSVLLISRSDEGELLYRSGSVGGEADSERFSDPSDAIANSVQAAVMPPAR